MPTHRHAQRARMVCPKATRAREILTRVLLHIKGICEQQRSTV